MILEAVHRTIYRYPSPARESHNEVRLMPLTDDSQVCHAFKLTVVPPATVFSYANIGGTVHYFNVREYHEVLTIEGRATVETLRSNPFEALDMLDNDWSFYSSDATLQGYAEFLADSPYAKQTGESRDIGHRARKSSTSIVNFLLTLNSTINDLLAYDQDVTNIHSTVEEVLSGRAGVCQDFAHVAITCCRTQGIPTRYVSGYLYGGDGIRGEQATHAWLECLLPSGQWLSLDPTNDIVANDHHIRVHLGRDYGDVSPTRGVYVGPPLSKLEVSVSVKEVAAVAQANG
jgi:transglutaminase-like putative cysteine protease